MNTKHCVTLTAEKRDQLRHVLARGKADVRKLYEMIFAAFDINWEITGMISEGNRVFAAMRRLRQVLG